MTVKSDQLEKLVQGYYRASQDKSVPAKTRLRFRLEANRGRALSRWFHELENAKANPTPEPIKKDP
jgi:hypothetical protein